MLEMLPDLITDIFRQINSMSTTKMYFWMIKDVLQLRAFLIERRVHPEHCSQSLPDIDDPTSFLTEQTVWCQHSAQSLLN